MLQSTQTPKKRGICNSKRLTQMERDAIRALYRAKNICQIDGTGLEGSTLKICLIYFDDVIAMGRTFEEELERLKQVFEKLTRARLKLKPKKCFSSSVSLVTEEGIGPDPGKVEQVRKWPIPENSTEVKSFLGLASYYRRFVSDFSTIVQPQYKLTETMAEFVWTGQCQLAFNSLKSLLTSSGVLAYPTREGKFVLDTDASDHGIAAVLSQFQDRGWMERPIAFASRTFSKSERNYCVTRREFLALVEFVKQHRHYLQVQDSAFELSIPSCALSVKLRTQKHHWHVGLNSSLSTFDFEIQYPPGQRHQNADALSGRPFVVRCRWCKSWKFQKKNVFCSCGCPDCNACP